MPVSKWYLITLFWLRIKNKSILLLIWAICYLIMSVHICCPLSAFFLSLQKFDSKEREQRGYSIHCRKFLVLWVVLCSNLFLEKSRFKRMGQFGNPRSLVWAIYVRPLCCLFMGKLLVANIQKCFIGLNSEIRLDNTFSKYVLCCRENWWILL